ncbi:DUF3320 domain-containing protein [Catenulispora pinisilvae]|uniref:DUF3320 domain-containing protein n=1 Tax=Catenulispora pinisilvae TaxID=2705253 RepID=UPI001891F30D|nr:DUF3320 domain-containing protein [Catenulispora pinisilvae]
METTDVTDAKSDREPGYGGASAEAQLRNTLQAWRESLIDQSGRNKLLNFRHTKTSTLELVQPAPAELLARLGNGWHVTYMVERTDDDGVAMPVETDPPLDPGTARSTKTSETELHKALRSLDRTSASFELDRGLWVLYLGLGMLHWADVDGKQYDSPLLLYPVRLERSGQGYEYRMVQHAGEEPAFNQSLNLRLEKLGVEQFPLPNLDDLDIDAYFRLVAGAVVGRDGWRVESRAVVAPFSFAKEVMYADLQKNAEALLRHDLVRTLGLSAHVESGVDLGFDPVPEERLDEIAPPETTPLIIDADSSQRQCVQAAVAGKSFVMNGPPGTGKTQTIANIIAALMNAGRSVLFVSEKAAALDVAYDRLASVGLGHYVLKLHSHQSTRKAVAQELGKALAFHQKPSADLNVMDRERLRELRSELSAYTAAMNEARTPLRRSLHDVIGRLAVMPETPAARYAGSDIRALSERDLARIVAASERAARSWRPVLEGDAFLWRGVTTGRDATLLVGEARNALRTLTDALAAHTAIVQPLDLIRLADVGRVLGILEAASSPPPVPQVWLTSDDIGSIEAAVSLFVETVHRVTQATADAERLAGTTWAAHRALAETAPPIVPSLSIRSVDASQLTADAIGGMLPWLRGMSQTAELLLAASSRLASLFGMPAPMMAGDVQSLCDLAALACQEHKPEAAWLDPSGLARARQAAQALTVAAAGLAQARTAACEVFTPEVLTASELSATTQRISQAGAVAKLGLSGQHRRDKAYAAALTRRGVFDRGVADALPRALAFQEAQRYFDQTTAEHRTALGSYFAGESTDFTLLDSVLRAAEDIAILGRQGDPARIRTLAAKGGRPDPAVATSEARLRDGLERWRTVPVEYMDSLDWTALGLLPLDEASAWCSEQMPALEYAEHVTAAISGTAGRTLTHAEALQALEAVATAVEAIDALVAREAEDRQTLGALYDAERTETANLDRAVAWAHAVRKAAMGNDRRPVPPQTAAHLLSGTARTRLTETSAAWESAAAAVSGLFDTGCRQEVDADLQREPAAVAELLDALQTDRGGIDQWLNYSEALAELEELGLGPGADWFVASRLTAELFATACERVALQAWAEDVIASDPRLRRGSADERDDRVATFTELDRRAVDGARSIVVRTIEAAKPLGIGGAAGRIKYEAEKKSRHKPVRDLIAENADVVLKIKPCFMMSPITVSQFIDPGIVFDAVIFDEASQVVPADAVNSVYRGRQLIVAGDQKQLPPTAFFSAVDDDDESGDDDENASTAADFASLLDRCVATRFTQLPLRWHYRSRHEGLIAFSNHSFYDDSLVTFPTPYEDLPDYGVKFFKVDGVYRRGSSRNNPKEAAAVAQRVLEHFQTRPGKSIGVVTLSVSQAGRIEDELERLRAQRPDLEQHFVQDRNKGLFVKSIENVQGDERDVIVLSVGYGPDENGKLTMAFGPMNSEGGERRLNVAVTRARQLVEVISSIRGAQIDAGKSVSRRHFKRYLEYAECGPSIFTRGLEASVGEPDSPFEESVLSVLASWGIAAVPQVGVAGYRIDIGIPHPDKPGVYVLGVECDGAMYHSAKTARDRDRLREQVLRGLGWNLHRIWGTAWYRDRKAAEEQLRIAIDRAITAYDEAVSTPPVSQAPIQGKTAAEQPSDTAELELVEAANAEDHRTWVVEYETWRVRPWTSPYEMHLPEARVGIRQIVLEVLQVEAPIHRDVLRDRARVAWGVGRAGRLIQENFATTLRAMASRGEVLLDSEFVDRPGRVTSPVRVHNDTSPRKVDQVPATERRLAIRRLDEESPGMTRDELIERTARLFGWQRLGSDIRATLENDLDHLIGNGEVGDALGRHDT